MSQPSTAAGALLSIAGLFGTATPDPELSDVRLRMEPVKASAAVRDDALAHATADEAAGLQRMLDQHLLVIH